jgi:Protein of unknown function (DUF3237)
MTASQLENLPVEFLFTERARLTDGIHKLARGPFGRRYLVPAVTGTFEGPRMRGILMPGLCNDFATVMADGVIDADVRMALRTDDDAVILAAASGRHSARYRGSRWPDSWRIAMTFEGNSRPLRMAQRGRCGRRRPLARPR